MSQTKGDNKTALKLINNYHILIQENKTLKGEIKDLRANIRINKEIIEGFFVKSNQKDLQNHIILKYQEENNKLYKQNESLNKELQILHQRNNFIEQTYSETLSREKDDNESLKMKLFIIEQSIIKKDNTITNLKKKTDYQKDDDFSYLEKEIYIIEPSKAIVQINDELLMYKQIYDNLITHVKEARESLSKAEATVNELQKENSKLRLQFKYQQICANREKETLLSAINQERSLSNTRNVNDKSSKSTLSANNGKYKHLLNTEDNMLLKKNKMNCSLLTTISNKDVKHDNEEFMEIVRQAGLHYNEYERLSKFKTSLKLNEIIEMLYSLIKDKNMTINVLKQENERLTSKNYQLNKDNMNIFQQNVELKKQVMLNKMTNTKDKTKDEDDDNSLINNTSQITVNQQINNAISTYHKLIKAEEKNLNLSDSIGHDDDIDSSQHDSIIYTKNIREESVETIKEIRADNKDDDMMNIPVKKHDQFNGDNNPKRNNIMTIESVTSSEFRDGCEGVDSFVVTIREDNDKDNTDSVEANKLHALQIKFSDI